jgi:hypothetical protein
MNSDRQFDVNQASSALSGGFSGHIRGHQDALVDALESQVCLKDGAGLHGNERFSEVVGNDDVDIALIHRSRAVDDVTDVNLVRGLLELVHKGKFYAPARVLWFPGRYMRSGASRTSPIRRRIGALSEAGASTARHRTAVGEPVRTARTTTSRSSSRWESPAGSSAGSLA